MTKAEDEKGEKNETGAWRALSEPVRRLMYNRADVGGVSWVGGTVWGRCCRLGRGKSAEGSHRRGKRRGDGEEQARKLCDDYPQTQGPSVLHPARVAERGWGAGAGFPNRCAGPGANQGGGGTEGVEEARKDKLQTKNRVEGRWEVLMMSWPPAAR